MGYSLPEIGDIMTSEPVNFILSNIKRSILSNDPYKNILDVASYFTNGVKLEHFLPNGGISKFELLNAINLNISTNSDTKDFSIDSLGHFSLSSDKLESYHERDWRKFLNDNKEALQHIP